MNNLVDANEAVGMPRPSGARRAWARVLGYVGAISETETAVARRGFSVKRSSVVERLETIGGQFVWGYNQAIGSSELHRLTAQLHALPPEDAGFAYEGAAMGLAIADWLTPGRRMFDAYIAGPAKHHEYMAWVGLGWALARLPVKPERALARYRNLHCWLALDGYGFHEGYFHWRDRISAQRRPEGLSADGRRVFDQGLGRSLWFVCGADVAAIASAIASFAPERHTDLWAGIGLAAAYAGGCDDADLATLVSHGGAHAGALAQGVVFAAEARVRAGNPVPHLERACIGFLGIDPGALAAIAVAAKPGGHSLADYQRWRLAIQRTCLENSPLIRSVGRRGDVDS